MPFDSQNAQVKVRSDHRSSAVDYSFASPFTPPFYDKGVKRALDVTLVLLSAVFVFPLITLMALLVARDGHSPFYTQTRVGQNGKTFRIIKIRTMVHNADALLKQKIAQDPEIRDEWAANQKLKNDFRVTPIGRILRKTSMDELPQLFNVLTGAMSLVGPRPMMPSQQHLYPGNSYYNLRPGITGFWQVSDRNDCEFQDRAKYDTAYQREISLVTDCNILFRTVAVVLRGTGH